MELFAALIGAILGAVTSFGLTEYFRRKDERRKFLASVRTEVALNLELAEEIIRANSDIDFDVHNTSSWQWCEIISFSDSAWTAILSTGGLVQLPASTIEPLSHAYAMARRANYVAAKIQQGRYHPRKGKEYSLRVEKARESLVRALRVLDAEIERSPRGPR